MNNIKIIFENSHYWVLDKPANLSVHDGAGEQDDLVSIWSKKYPKWAQIPWTDQIKKGLVHRLDKDTSGIILMAKNPIALEKLQSLFQQRNITKHYKALCAGECLETFQVEASIARDRKNRQKQSANLLDLPWQNQTKIALTDFKINNSFIYNGVKIFLLDCFPKTGRMHQIRVHLKLKNLPILGDAKYANKLTRNLNKKLNIQRQMLHALNISFVDPWTKKAVNYHAPLHPDFIAILQTLEQK